MDAHRRELGHDVAEWTLAEAGGRRVVRELDLTPLDGVGARDAQRAVDKDALHVGQMPPTTSAFGIAQRRVQEIAQPVAEQVRAQHDEGDHEPGSGGEPPRIGQVVTALSQH
jgi:hypothetical protein